MPLYDPLEEMDKESEAAHYALIALNELIAASAVDTEDTTQAA